MNRYIIFILTALFIASCKPNPVDFPCCEKSLSISGNSSLIVSFPNAITPNGDGLNEVLRVYVVDSVTNLNDTSDVLFILYNQNNTIVYQDSAYHNNFSGISLSGQSLSDGNYPAKFILIDGTIINFTLTIRRTQFTDAQCCEECRPYDLGDPFFNVR